MAIHRFLIRDSPFLFRKEMGKRKPSEIETHGIILPATSRNSGAEWNLYFLIVTSPAPELNARLVPPTRTAVDFGSLGSGTSTGWDLT
jgi:hypothetical protein